MTTVYTVVGLYRGKFPMFNTLRNIYTFATKEEATEFVAEAEKYFKDEPKPNVDTWIILEEETTNPRDAMLRQIVLQARSNAA